MTNSVVITIAPALRKNLHIYKQVLATLASCFLSSTGGITFGFTAVLLPQLKNDSVFPYDPSFDSWIASISPLAMMCGCIFSGSMSDGLGRKTGQLLIIIPYTIGWIIMGVAPNNVIMLLGRFITGFCAGSVRPVGMVYIGELSDPKNRAITLVCPSLAVYVGSLLSHTAGHYLPWRTACFVFALPNIVCFVMLLFLKESPLWLINKGKTEKGIKSFKEFRGEGEAAQKELKAVLEKQEQKVNTSSFKEFTNTLFSKAMMKSMLNICLLFLAVQFCGINTITFYAQEIFASTFSDEIDAFMLMIVTDVIRVITSSVMCLFAKKVPRRTTFLVSCYSTVLLLLALVVYLYIKPVGLLWVAITCLVVYLGIASALTCISWSFVAEIFPSNVRGLGSGVSSLISFGLLFISVKITPGVLHNFGDAAMYGGFAVITLVSAVFLTFLLPETNGKSLQDIENSLYNKKTIHMQSRPAADDLSGAMGELPVDKQEVAGSITAAEQRFA